MTENDFRRMVLALDGAVEGAHLARQLAWQHAAAKTAAAKTRKRAGPATTKRVVRR